MHLIDVHAHLDMPQFAEDLDQVLQRAAGAGVGRIISVGVDLESSRRCVELARIYPNCVYAAVGIHPHHAGEASPAAMDELARMAQDTQVIAIGETGLDFHCDSPSRDCQRAAFEAQVGLATAVGKPLIIHARSSDDEVLHILGRQGCPVRGVRHCFDRPASVATAYLELGLHISVGAAVTRPGYKKFKAGLRDLPSDRLLLETDCPYQAPVQQQGLRNEPAFMAYTLEAIAALRGVSPQELACATTANAERLFLAGRGADAAL